MQSGIARPFGDALSSKVNHLGSIMPTLKPRISITLEDEDLAILDRFAAASGTPRASVIAQMVHSASPELERAARMMEAANAAPSQMLQKVRSDLAAATDAVTGSLAPAEEAYRLLLRSVRHSVLWKPVGEVRRGVEGAAGDTRSGAGVAPTSPRKRRPGPPPTNRGVKS